MAHCYQPKPAAHHCVQPVKQNLFKGAHAEVYQPPHCKNTADDHYIVVSEDQIMNFLERYDVNRDGFLNKSELKKAFENMGAFFPEWRVGRALAVADKNCDGHTGLDELEDVLLYAKKCGYNIC